MGLVEIMTSPAVSQIQAVISAAFFVAGMKNKKWFVPAFVVGFPAIWDAFTLVVINSDQLYYAGLSVLACALIIYSKTNSMKFASMAFLVLVFVCATMMIVTKYISLPGFDMDAIALGKTFFLLWLAMDMHIILSTFYADNDGHRYSTPIKR